MLFLTLSCYGKLQAADVWRNYDHSSLGVFSKAELHQGLGDVLYFLLKDASGLNRLYFSDDRAVTLIELNTPNVLLDAVMAVSDAGVVTILSLEQKKLYLSYNQGVQWTTFDLSEVLNLNALELVWLESKLFLSHETGVAEVQIQVDSALIEPILSLSVNALEVSFQDDTYYILYYDTSEKTIKVRFLEESSNSIWQDSTLFALTSSIPSHLNFVTSHDEFYLYSESSGNVTSYRASSLNGEWLEGSNQVLNTDEVLETSTLENTYLTVFGKTMNTFDVYQTVNHGVEWNSQILSISDNLLWSGILKSGQSVVITENMNISLLNSAFSITPIEPILLKESFERSFLDWAHSPLVDSYSLFINESLVKSSNLPPFEISALSVGDELVLKAHYEGLSDNLLITKIEEPSYQLMSSSLFSGTDYEDFKLITFPEGAYVIGDSGARQSPLIYLQDQYGVSEDPLLWRFGRWDPITESYQTNLDEIELEPGHSYWYIGVMDLEVDMQTNSERDEAYIRVQPGWNMIGNPFNEQVDWEEVRVKRGLVEYSYQNILDDLSFPLLPDLWAWNNGSYSSELIMTPGEGYWVRNLGDEELLLLVKKQTLLAKSRQIKRKVQRQSTSETPPKPPSLQASSGASGGGGGCLIR